MTTTSLGDWASLRPHPAAGVTLLQRGAVATLYDTHGGAHLLDDVALGLWELCDGETRVEEMVDAVCALFTADTSVVSRDVVQTLEALLGAGLLTARGDGTDDGAHHRARQGGT